MNSTLIIGRLGKDPELKQTTTGKDVCNFTVAVARKFNKDETDWYSVTAWEHQARYVAEYLSKGRLVAVQGRMESRKHEGTTYWDLVADDVRGLDRPTETTQSGNQSQSDAPTNDTESDEYDPFADE